jgi:hypothetical protein
MVLRDSKAPDDPGAFVSCDFFNCSEAGGINRQRGSLLVSWSCEVLGLDRFLVALGLQPMGYSSSRSFVFAEEKG